MTEEATYKRLADKINAVAKELNIPAEHLLLKLEKELAKMFPQPETR
jgi:hypothetical protein